MAGGSWHAADEARPHADRLASQEAHLRRVLSAAAPHAPALRTALGAAGLRPEDVVLADLPRLPLLRKEHLPAMQAQDPPFGGWLGERETLRRIFVSPGPIYDPEAGGEDYWGFAPALHAAGFRAGDVALNTFSYHFTPAGAMFDGALAALGCVTVPTGVGNLDLQVKTLLDLRARAFIGTPSFLAAVVAKLKESGTPSPLEVAFVSGEPLPEPLRAELEGGGLRVSQGYATGDIGLIAYECPMHLGLHLADRVIVELVDPETGAAVAREMPGEVVVTFLHELYPLLRLATGDLSRLTQESCPCGRTAPRLVRILGRVGDAVKVRGLFLHPLELDRAMARHPEVLRYQATITRGADHQDVLTVAVDVRPGTTDEIIAGVAQSVREATRLRANITVMAPGTIPADAKKIVDRRQWD